MNWKRSILMSVCLSLCSVAAATAADRPNILIILCDDMGFSDLGCYGSEIDTPNLDQLASEGLRFSQFYNTAKCHSSRISLLTGRYAFQAGNTSLQRAVTSAEVLGAAGYFTAMTGKWHLQREPTDFGFDRYFGHLSGACNYFLGDKTFRLNGQPWSVPETGFYTTVADVDYALKFLREARESSQPWYLYVAFNAPHAPLQPLEIDYKKYLGRYDVGWDVIHADRTRRQHELGLFAHPFDLPPRPDHIPTWNTLSPKRRQWESRRMAAYAALIDRVDQELGRLLADLKHNGELDNTFILFLSDNGACPYDRRNSPMDAPPYHPETRWSDSTGWAWARNAPFRYYKQNQFEGGIATPAIVHWPVGLKTAGGTVAHDPAHLVDVLPTIAELAGADLPESWPGRELEPIAGVSLVPVLRGGRLDDRPPIHLLFSSDRGLRDGDWKLVSFRSNPWELYNIADDRAERHNVAARHPDIVKRMAKQWYEMAENVLKAPAKARQPVRTQATPNVHPQWTDFTREPDDAGPTRKRRSGLASIRARRDTRLSIDGDTLVLTCTGTDSGIAIDQVGSIESAGPYVLSFSLKSDAGDSGELFFTTDAGTKLPAGTRVGFEIPDANAWHNIELKLETTSSIVGLRLDPGDQVGEARIRNLILSDANGNRLRQWPANPFNTKEKAQ